MCLVCFENVSVVWHGKQLKHGECLSKLYHEAFIVSQTKGQIQLLHSAPSFFVHFILLSDVYCVEIFGGSY